MSVVAQETKTAPLVRGDKLTREQFIRLWDMHPEIKRAELIGGIVYMPSPVSIDHGDLEEDVGGWMYTYRVNTPGVASSANASTMMLDDMPQPDRHLRILPECGGRTQIVGKYLHGGPEFVAEVCLSSTSYDLNQKHDLYEAAGVQEYLAVLAYEQEIRWHALVDGRYQVMPPDVDGIWRSKVLPGLWLNGPALLQRDSAAVLATLQQGLAAPEHRQFVELLAKRRQQSS